MWWYASGAERQFLSTPSARRATANSSGATVYTDVFLSTPSARRATWPSPSKEVKINISIHALREEGDPWARS